METPEQRHSSPCIECMGLLPHEVEAQAAADLEAVQTDQQAYAFIEKYLSKDLRGRYLAIYRSDRHEMNRSPRQALDNLLALPPLE